MNCKKCGFQLTVNDQFCKNCGTPIDNTSVQNNNVGLGSQQTQTYTQPAMQQQSVFQQPINNYGQPSMPQQSMQQPSWTSGYNAQPIKPTNKNSNAKFIIIGIIIVAVIVGIIVAIGIFSGKKSNNSGTNSGGASTVNNNSVYTVKFKGFTFKIPTDLIYETQLDSIFLGNEADTWGVSIEVVEGSYSQMLSKKSLLQSTYQSSGYTASAAIERTINGMSFITLEVSKSGTNILMGLAKANSTNLFVIAIYTVNNEYDYKLLETVSSILSNTEYTGETNDINLFEKFDTSKIAELAK